MEQIHITLPDGSVQEVPKGTTPADVARRISPRLADAALVARVAQPASGKDAPQKNGEGELIDLRRPLDHDVSLQILTEKDPDALFVFRHSAAHLLAAAVMELYPNVKLGIGPPVDTGFFYEFLRDEPFTPEDLAKIEKKMHELAAQDLPNERKLIPKPEALDLYKKSNQVFKCELVEEKASEPMVSFYTTGSSASNSTSSAFRRKPAPVSSSGIPRAASFERLSKIGSATNCSSAATTSSLPRTSCASTSGKPAATPLFSKKTCSAPSRSRRPTTSSSP